MAKYVKQTLEGDSTLNGMFTGGKASVYNEGAPHNAGKGPYIVFNVPGGSDHNSVDGNRILTPGDVNISVCIQDKGYGSIKAIADRIDEIMKATTQVVVDDVFITKFVRKAIIMVSNDSEDVYWYYLGGMYEADVFEYDTMSAVLLDGLDIVEQGFPEVISY